MKNKLKLVLPSRKYASSYIKLEKEFLSEKSKAASGGMDILVSVKDFSLYNKNTTNKRNGIGLPKGKVPNTLYWAVVGNKVVGRLSLRHFLNERLRREGGHIGYGVTLSERRKGYATEMLRLGLKKAKKLGIRKVLVTCLEKNIASKKVIEHNGGVFASKVKIDKGPLLRFWIKN